MRGNFKRKVIPRGGKSEGKNYEKVKVRKSNSPRRRGSERGGKSWGQNVVERKFIGSKCREKETVSYEGKCCRGEMS